MAQFLSCLCEKDYSVLGGSSDLERHEAWLDIVQQYYELQGDTVNTVSEWKLQRNIVRLQNHIYLVNVCILFLAQNYSESIADSLRKLGYTFNPVIKLPEQYQNMLRVVLTKSKQKEIQLEGFKKELAKLAEETGAVPPTRERFAENLTYIEEMQKISYDFDTLTVYKYLILEKKLTNRIQKEKADAVSRTHRRSH